MQVNFPIRHRAAVVVTKDCTFDDGTPRLAKGDTGHVIAMVAKEGRAQYLVKWKGRSWPCYCWLDEIAVQLSGPPIPAAAERLIPR